LDDALVVWSPIDAADKQRYSNQFQATMPGDFVTAGVNHHTPTIRQNEESSFEQQQ
jgi:hypothetical protein